MMDRSVEISGLRFVSICFPFSCKNVHNYVEIVHVNSYPRLFSYCVIFPNEENTC